jgi:broad specificity phosphatase PhoE
MDIHRRDFYFLRHGQTDWNRLGLMQGQTDMPLNGLGLTQARKAAALLADAGIATICTSPLKRALLTAEIIAARLHVPIRVIAGLKECAFGIGEGSPRGEWLESWRRGGRLDGAESHAAFIERTLGGLNEALRQPGPVLIVAHGGTYWAVQRATGLDRLDTVPNGLPIHHIPPAKPLLGWQQSGLGEATAAA